MTALFAEAALLPDGWRDNVLLEIDPAGNLVTVKADVDAASPAAAAAERLDGPALPGMPNLHSHAFQRAMAGLAEAAERDPGSFWSWRPVMYRFAGALGPDDLEAIAAQLQIEMLKAGYTAVCEFHYLHNAPDGSPYADPASLPHAVLAAARRTGIGLTMLPVLYQTGGFGGLPPNEGQRRFVLSVDRFLALVAGLAGEAAGDGQLRIGVAPHSLRAVPPKALGEMLAGLGAVDPTAPIHIHAAEQVREVEDCLGWCGSRPVEWLLDHTPIDQRWCLVHATHMTAREMHRLAASGAVVGLCPTTEANLGDGLFPLEAFQAAGGTWGIGSDSNVSVNPVEELRWLEYGRRLSTLRRTVAALPGESTGAILWSRALEGGAAASGRRIGALAPGYRADLVVLDGNHPLIYGRDGNRLLDALVFAGSAPLVRHVLVGGQWRVRDGRHEQEAGVAAAYRRVLDRLL
ncbi:formimidoylglutamate deiminase [Aliidongia dinghuensis]|uniref:Formimidoylglutamate deiminase n=1 Tax=Aliidongia dinghuensis TaxID=1867774 RepID=A0A8J2YQ71_9PROT|nr:formimidoylglutamate deiminase [Aliidongia dinghuensis]GGF03775.1 formimidoylglutamate deiminase [Aliidongia dinghuensis]